MYMLFTLIAKFSRKFHHSMFYTIYPASDVIKIDVIIKQNGGRLASLVLQYFLNEILYKKFDNRYYNYFKESYRQAKNIWLYSCNE